MLPSLREALTRHLNTEELTALLKEKPANKLEIWETLKIDSFTRTITAVYSSCMLMVMLRVQLNIIGGYMYLDTLETPDGTVMPVDSMVATPNVQQRYLAMIQYVVDQGLGDLIIAVRASVKKVVGSVSLKELLSLKAIQEIINSVRQEVEFRTHQGYHDASTSSLCRFMMAEDAVVEPQAGATSREDLVLHKLTKETRDIIESGDFHSVLTMCLDTAFVKLVDKVSEYYKVPPQVNGTIVNPNDIQMAMAKMIPIVNGMVNVIAGDAPNQFVQEMLLKEQVKDFAANVYEAFSQSAEQTRA